MINLKGTDDAPLSLRLTLRIESLTGGGRLAQSTRPQFDDDSENLDGIRANETESLILITTFEIADEAQAIDVYELQHALGSPNSDPTAMSILDAPVHTFEYLGRR